MSIAGSIRGLIVRAVARITNDDSKLQEAELQGLEGQTRSAVEVYWPYGLRAHAPAGSVGILLHMGGDQSDPAMLPPAHRDSARTGLTENQVVVYSADGTEIFIPNDATIVIKAGAKVRIETPLLEVTGEIKDRCDSGGSTMSEMRAQHDDHDHDENDSGGPTNKPNQLMGGH